MTDVLGAVSIGLGILSLLILGQPFIAPGAIPNIGLINLMVSAAAIGCGVIARGSGSRMGCIGIILGAIPIVALGVVLVLMAITYG